MTTAVEGRVFDKLFIPRIRTVSSVSQSDFEKQFLVKLIGRHRDCELKTNKVSQKNHIIVSPDSTCPQRAGRCLVLLAVVQATSLNFDGS